jgi:hypothetical protein
MYRQLNLKHKQAGQTFLNLYLTNQSGQCRDNKVEAVNNKDILKEMDRNIQ